MGRILKERDVEAAVKGGSVYAAGGGGFADHGRMLGYAAVSIGKPELVDIEELNPKDWVATAAAIGAPASLIAAHCPPACAFGPNRYPSAKYVPPSQPPNMCNVPPAYTPLALSRGPPGSLPA